MLQPKGSGISKASRSSGKPKGRVLPTIDIARKRAKIDKASKRSQMTKSSNKTGKSYKDGGKVKKAKEPLKNKVKRKISQVKNRKTEKLYSRTHNSGLRDKGNPKDQGGQHN